MHSVNQKSLHQNKILLVIFTTFCMLATLAPLQAQNENQYEKITLDGALSGGRMFFAARPSGITWFPDGKSFLFRFREEGKNILWRYDAASGQKTKIVDWGEIESKLNEMAEERTRPVMGDVNAAARVSNLPSSLSHDGTMLLGSSNSDLYVFHLASGDVEFVTNDPETEIWPTFSPDDKKIAFAREKDLYWLDIDSGQVTRLTDRGDNMLIYNGVPDWVYDEEFALRRAFWWSPDSKHIVFIKFDTSPIKTFPIVDHLETVAALEEQQYPKAGDPNAIVKLGILDITDGDLKWIDIGKDPDSYIARVGWLPDGSKLWLQWLDRDQTIIDLMFADPETGHVQSIVQEKDSAWVEVTNDLQFVDNERFIWTSERSGWRHIYLYRTDGTLLRQLTDGEWEVTGVDGFDSSKEFVYFTATEVSPLERHVYRVGLDGNGFERLSQGEGMHSINKADVGDYYIGSFSSPTTPNRQDIFSKAGEKLSEFSSGEIPALKRYHLALPEYFTIKSEDGVDLWASMIKPVDFDPGKKYPVLVSIYGGPGSQAVTKRFSVNLFQQYLVQEGIIIFRLDNRGTGARGRDFSRVMHRRLGYWELKDHVEGVKYLKTLPYIDGKHIAIQGGSYGGYMTLYALLKAPEYFQFGVSLYPVTDWRYYDTIYTERYMDTPQNNSEGYKESAPVNFAGGLHGKLFLVHGTMDNNVHVQNSIMMIEKLVAAGKDFKLMLYPRERHGIRTRYRNNHLNRSIAKFLMNNLLGKEPQ